MKPFLRDLTIVGFAVVALSGPVQAGQTGNVIFFHPDGTGLAHWDAVRAHKVGPDGKLNWDRVPEIGVYTGYVKDNLIPRSHSGATIHAYGVKVVRESFGMDGTRQLIAASGKPMSVAEEALAAGKSLGLIQSGHIAQPGTAAFVASVPSRKEGTAIARQVIESGAEVIMAGGEKYLLPEGVEGRHGPGVRQDGLDLIKRAQELGYEIVYTRNELLKLDLSQVDKILGVFAFHNTFRDTEGKLEKINTSVARFFSQLFDVQADEPPSPYLSTAPTIAEMTEVALQILSRNEAGFLLVAEEEGTDNLANMMDAAGQLEALARADDAIGTMLRFIEERDDTLLLIAADSDSNGMQIIGGDDFVAQQTATGVALPFSIGWANDRDTGGGVLVRAAGLNRELLKPLMDNTDIYRLIHLTLLGEPGSTAPSLFDTEKRHGYATEQLGHAIAK